MKTYLKSFEVASCAYEANFMECQRMTCYTSYYPFNVFEARNFAPFEFDPITIFYGSNGSGKSTLLNVIAEKLGLIYHGVHNTSEFMGDYLDGCEAEHDEIPGGSMLITSDDVFNYLLDVRYMNMGIDARRVDVFAEYYDRKKPMQLHSMDDYENYKKHVDAVRTSGSRFVKSNLLNNVTVKSNGESAIRFFTTQIQENALYLLDEPENSLAPKMQMELKKYIEQSARGYDCQFVIATHSPFLLALENAKIYDLDDVNGSQKTWNELENTRVYYEFFKEHERDFEK